MARSPQLNDSGLLQWFFELAISEKARIIGLLLSASVFTWNVLTTLAKSLDEHRRKLRERIPPKK